MKDSRNTASPDPSPLVGGKESDDTLCPAWLEHTARKLAERDLLEMALLSEKAPDPIIEISLEGNVTFCNAAARRVFTDIIPLGHRHPVLDGLAAVVERFVTGNEAEHVRDIAWEGKRYEQRFSLHPCHDRVRIFHHDVTENRALDALARRLQRVLARERTDTFRMIEGFRSEILSELLVLEGYSSLLQELLPGEEGIHPKEIFLLLASCLRRVRASIDSFSESYSILSSFPVSYRECPPHESS
ncbi:MAG: PAS domain-containing protein [Bacteroidota bacterium]|nr:PAS domain-containing protein [Bacteroidota bacterium]